MEHSSEPSTLVVEVSGERRSLPIYSIRDLSRHREIAWALASGKKAVMFGMGLWGIVKAVEDPRTQGRLAGRRGESRVFWEVKVGRPRQSKIPVMVPPEQMGRLIDFGKLHPRYRFLRNRGAREKLWAHGAPFHGIFPLKSRTHIDEAFVTRPEELPEDWRVPYSTVSIFWMEDPAWHNLARLAGRITSRSLLGVSSVNTHGEEPPFTYDELVSMLSRKPEWDFDLLVRDEATESVDLKSSHTQIRFPLHYEEPECVVLRIGSLSARGFAEATGLPVRVHEHATIASRGHPLDANLDDRVWEAVRRAREVTPYRKAGVIGWLLQRTVLR